MTAAGYADPPDHATGPVANPLVAAPEEESGWTGHGLGSAIGDTVGAAADGDGADTLLSGAGAGLDALGYLADPFGSVVGDGAGWLIENVWFLREPLDALAGDPVQIAAIARTWSNVAGELRAVARDYEQDLPGPPAWSGRAGEAYRDNCATYCAGLRETATHLDGLARTIVHTGVMVGLEREAIRDLIVDFITRTLRTLAVAMIAPPAAAPMIIYNAGALALQLYRRVVDLLERMEQAGGAVAAVADGVTAAARSTRRVAPEVMTYAGHVQDQADQLYLSDVVQGGQVLGEAVEPEPTGP